MILPEAGGACGLTGHGTPKAGGHPLDNPAWAALTGPHANLAEANGQAVRYPVAMCPFVALPDRPGTAAWADLAGLAGPGAVVSLAGVREAPPGWEVVMRVLGVQMVGAGIEAGVEAGIDAAPDGEAQVLGLRDVPEMLDLVARTRPGPFLPRTVELGTYLGVRRRGALVAMAGERLHPFGWREISAVCTDDAHGGRGLAGRLVRAVTAGIRGRGETPFLHAVATNTAAIRLYESLGFTPRREVTFLAVRIPAAVVPAAFVPAQP
jgi:ribosomal protein S18 acetylase RimI-like enzyme